jgi:hypothetical protein
MIGDVFVLKSGTDFQEFSEIKLILNVDEEEAKQIL